MSHHPPIGHICWADPEAIAAGLADLQAVGPGPFTMHGTVDMVTGLFTLAPAKAFDDLVHVESHRISPTDKARDLMQAEFDVVDALQPFADAAAKMPSEQHDSSPAARVNADGSYPGTFTTLTTKMFRAAQAAVAAYKAVHG